MNALSKVSIRISNDSLVGLGASLAGIVSLVASFQIQNLQGSGFSGYIGPRAFPVVLSSLLIVLGILLLLRRRPSTSGADTESVGDRRTLLVMSLAIVAYLTAFQVIGFILSTALFLFGVFMYLGERRLWLAATIGGVLSVLISLLFTKALNVALPTGFFGF